MIKKNLTKKEIAGKINSKLGYSIEESKEFLDFIFNIIIERVKNGEEVKIPELGNFSSVLKNERVGRNPKTGKRAVISKRRVVRYRPSKLLRTRINN